MSAFPNDPKVTQIALTLSTNSRCILLESYQLDPNLVSIDPMCISQSDVDTENPRPPPELGLFFLDILHICHSMSISMASNCVEK